MNTPGKNWEKCAVTGMISSNDSAISCLVNAHFYFHLENKNSSFCAFTTILAQNFLKYTVTKFYLVFKTTGGVITQGQLSMRSFHSSLRNSFFGCCFFFVFLFVFFVCLFVCFCFFFHGAISFPIPLDSILSYILYFNGASC